MHAAARLITHTDDHEHIIASSDANALDVAACLMHVDFTLVSCHSELQDITQLGATVSIRGVQDICN